MTSQDYENVMAILCEAKAVTCHMRNQDAATTMERSIHEKLETAMAILRKDHINGLVAEIEAEAARVA